MPTVHKYPFEVAKRFDLELPGGATILRAECQRTQPCLWALVDTEEPPERVSFHLYGTGDAIDPGDAEGLEHVDTFQQGPYVWHLFRGESRPAETDEPARAVSGRKARGGKRSKRKEPEPAETPETAP